MTVAQQLFVVGRAQPGDRQPQIELLMEFLKLPRSESYLFVGKAVSLYGESPVSLYGERLVGDCELVPIPFVSRCRSASLMSFFLSSSLMSFCLSASVASPLFFCLSLSFCRSRFSFVAVSLLPLSLLFRFIPVWNQQEEYRSSTMPLYNHTITHSHTILITCTCCDDQIKGTQDKDFSYSFSDSLSSFLSCSHLSGLSGSGV